MKKIEQILALNARQFTVSLRCHNGQPLQFEVGRTSEGRVVARLKEMGRLVPRPITNGEASPYTKATIYEYLALVGVEEIENLF